MALMIPYAKLREWEEFNEALEKDFQLASRRLWQIVQRFIKGKQTLSQAVLMEGEPLGLR